MAAVDGSSGGQWIFFPNELKSPKNNMAFLFFIHSIFGGWVAGSDPNMNKSLIISSKFNFFFASYVSLRKKG